MVKSKTEIERKIDIKISEKKYRKRGKKEYVR